MNPIEIEPEIRALEMMTKDFSKPGDSVAPTPSSVESFVRDITGYTLSNDHAQLANLVKSQSVICTVKYITCRDVAHTTYYRSSLSGEETFTIGARGIGYVHAWGLDDFLRQCAQFEVRFIPPNA